MSQKNCLITGGPRGIGRATALLAAKAGWAVSIAGLAEHMDDANAVVKEIEAAGGKAVAIAADVSKEAEIVAMFDEAERRLGPVRGVVNAAGMPYGGPVTGLAFAPLEKMMTVNIVGLIVCCREAARRMSTASGGQGGSIVNISSLAVTIGGRPGAAAYAASKAAVDCFTTGMAREVANQGIRVNTVRPGAIVTAMTAAMTATPEQRAHMDKSIPLGRMGEPEEIGEVAVWLLSDHASLVSGAHVNAGGGGFVIA
ncbi:MAG: SDR family oxidoreductase [Proteobacteria bacterium]|nr:SDR family oxidoreductase [Pseudomonadota bacterium]